MNESTCTPEGTFNALALRPSELDGILPAELGQLTGVQFIDLAGNGIWGSIPNEIGDLRLLASLDLCQNKLIGTIPLSLAKLTHLTKLHVYDNYLSGTIPLALFGAPHVRTLKLLVGSDPKKASLPTGSNHCIARNSEPWLQQTHRVHPKQHGRCLQLERVCSAPEPIDRHNSYQSLKLNSVITFWHIFFWSMFSPHMVRALTTIPLWLDVHGNVLAGNLDLIRWTELMSATRIDLGHNRFTGSIPPSLGSTTKLNALILRENLLHGTIPESVLDLKDLIYMGKSNLWQWSWCILPTHRKRFSAHRHSHQQYFWTP
jgi:Leucine-rich repeat (LRR) protein